MNTLKAEKRDLNTKAKRLRREGYVTGNVFGKEIQGSIPVKILLPDAEALLKYSGKGSRVMLDVDGQKINALIKEIDYNSLKHQILEIDFQALVKGEKVHSVAEVVLLNHEKATAGVIQLLLEEISYKATPDALVEKVEIDAADLKIGDTVKVKDLDIAKNENIDLLTSPDAIVVSVSEVRNTEDAAETESEDTDA
mgnify:FL=1